MLSSQRVEVGPACEPAQALRLVPTCVGQEVGGDHRRVASHRGGDGATLTWVDPPTVVGEKLILADGPVTQAGLTLILREMAFGRFDGRSPHVHVVSHKPCTLHGERRAPPLLTITSMHLGVARILTEAQTVVSPAHSIYTALVTKTIPQKAPVHTTHSLDV